MAIRQRRGHNRWTELQEFAASGLAVDVTAGDLRIGNRRLKDDGNLLSARTADDTAADDFRADQLSAYGGMLLIAGGAVTTSGGGNIQLLPDTGGITKIGNANTTSHGLNTNDDLFVTGKLEVSAGLYVDNGIWGNNAKFYTDTGLQDGIKLKFGADVDLVWQWDDTNGLVDCTTGGSGPLALPAPTAAPTLQTASTMTLSVDETNDELDVTVKYSDGSVHTGTVTLV